MTRDIEPPKAYLHWELSVECEVCHEGFDMARDDSDNTVSKAIFNNKWDSLAGHEVTCPECGHEFKIAGVEY